MKTETEVINVSKIQSLLNLHEKAAELLGLIVDEENAIELTQESADNFKAIFGRINPSFANDLLLMRRTQKRLNRSYNKVMHEIKKNESN